mmetsp:Transcript_28556/g.72323  ORF Transcript_28556/g.72323 Transcript_28556/m.72323 type:complete len:202 (+) Transcript_28556:1083-1688(+)
MHLQYIIKSIQDAIHRIPKCTIAYSVEVHQVQINPSSQPSKGHPQLHVRRESRFIDVSGCCGLDSISLEFVRDEAEQGPECSFAHSESQSELSVVPHVHPLLEVHTRSAGPGVVTLDVACPCVHRSRQAKSRQEELVRHRILCIRELFVCTHQEEHVEKLTVTARRRPRIVAVGAGRLRGVRAIVPASSLSAMSSAPTVAA